MRRFGLAALVLLAVGGAVRADCGGSRVFAVQTTAVVSPFVVTAVPTVVASPVTVSVNAHGCFLNQAATEVFVAPSVVKTQVVRQRVRVIRSRRGRSVRVFAH